MIPRPRRVARTIGNSCSPLQDQDWTLRRRSCTPCGTLSCIHTARGAKTGSHPSFVAWRVSKGEASLRGHSSGASQSFLYKWNQRRHCFDRAVSRSPSLGLLSWAPYGRVRTGASHLRYSTEQAVNRSFACGMPCCLRTPLRCRHICGCSP